MCLPGIAIAICMHVLVHLPSYHTTCMYRASAIANYTHVPEHAYSLQLQHACSYI